MNIITKHFRRKRVKEMYEDSRMAYLRALNEFMCVMNINSRDEATDAALREVELKFKIMNDYQHQLESLD